MHLKASPTPRTLSYGRMNTLCSFTAGLSFGFSANTTPASRCYLLNHFKLCFQTNETPIQFLAAVRNSLYLVRQSFHSVFDQNHLANRSDRFARPAHRPFRICLSTRST